MAAYRAERKIGKPVDQYETLAHLHPVPATGDTAYEEDGNVFVRSPTPSEWAITAQAAATRRDEARRRARAARAKAMTTSA